MGEGSKKGRMQEHDCFIANLASIRQTSCVGAALVAARNAPPGAHKERPYEEHLGCVLRRLEGAHKGRPYTDTPNPTVCKSGLAVRYPQF